MKKNEFAVYGMSYGEWTDEEYRDKTYAFIVSRELTSSHVTLRKPCYETLAAQGVVAIFPVNIHNNADKARQYEIAKALCKFLDDREKAMKEALAKVDFGS